MTWAHNIEQSSCGCFQAYGPEASVMADTLAVLHSHTVGAAHEVQTGPDALSNARQGPMGLLATSEGVLMARQVGSQKAAGADAARRPLTSPASQRSGSSKAASSKATAPKAGPKQARHGEHKYGPGNILLRNRRTCFDSVCGLHIAPNRNTAVVEQGQETRSSRARRWSAQCCSSTWQQGPAVAAMRPAACSGAAASRPPIRALYASIHPRTPLSRVTPP